MRLWCVMLVIAGSCLSVADVQAEVSDHYLPTWLQNRVVKLQARFAPRTIEKIGWADDIEQAFELSKQHDRPVMMFTHDGHLDVGRC